MSAGAGLDCLAIVLSASDAVHPPCDLTCFQATTAAGTEHNLAKVGVEGSNPFARSKVSLN
jgi:hypothetical protein